jgi:hypothetical protein
MFKHQPVSTHKFIFDTLLDDLLWQFVISSNFDLVDAHACVDAINNALIAVLDVGSLQPFDRLKEQLPSLEGRAIYRSWWQDEYFIWTEELQTTVSFYRNIQTLWHFNNERKIIQRYYDANRLLIECLEANYKITIELRQEIEAALLLPPKAKMPKKRCRQNEQAEIIYL